MYVPAVRVRVLVSQCMYFTFSINIGQFVNFAGCLLGRYHTLK